ncbi:2840_t:CDS:2 [Gigaspora rosea]|nr:2840_t:CDS:2 [Gigaspora rosea]
MGVFNENINRKTIPKTHILQQLQDLGLTSLFDFYDISELTWARRDSSSQIDDIWAAYSVLLEPQLLDTQESTKSNHKIIITKITIDEPVIRARMDEEKCEEFSAMISKKIDSSNWSNITITNEKLLNKYWISIYDTIKQHREAAHSAERDSTGKYAEQIDGQNNKVNRAQGGRLH